MKTTSKAETEPTVLELAIEAAGGPGVVGPACGLTYQAGRSFAPHGVDTRNNLLSNHFTVDKWQVQP